ncbi:hypothetical protein TIFTF001_008769 [Ficus carica]|uniref:Uncharacterized protein n=1 Tax=Ficus carica TaxID=3494 RepID=A0AA88CYD0_FICCA|nr:hypothetical protein TIFTF001_008769 [Ficus carica]
MAEFPPNLDDGELWLPSDIFLNEVPSKRGLHLHRFSPCMDDLAQRLAAFSLLKQRNLISKPNVQRFVPVRCGLENGSYTQEQDCSHRFCGCKLVPKPAYGGSEVFYQFQLRKPVQLPKVDDGFLETRASVLQKQQNHLLNRLQNRPLPSRESGFVKVSGGTGVFHPRVVLNTTTTSTTTTSSAFVKKKQVSRNRQEIQAPSSQRINRPITTTSLGGVKSKEFHNQLPPELCLPKDWTY